MFDVKGILKFEEAEKGVYGDEIEDILCYTETTNYNAVRCERVSGS